MYMKKSLKSTFEFLMFYNFYGTEARQVRDAYYQNDSEGGMF